MDQPGKTIRRFAYAVWGIASAMSDIRREGLTDPISAALAAAKRKATGEQPSESLLVYRRLLDELAKDVADHITAPPNQTGKQWVLRVLALADRACRFADDADPKSVARVWDGETIETVCQRHDYQGIERELEEASSYAFRGAVLAGVRDLNTGGAGSGGKGIRLGVNARMIETIQTIAEALGWNSTQWAKHLKCAKSSVVATKTWKDLTMGRERTKAERAKDRRRRPKGSDLDRD
jgi:hypothetical protein